MDDNALTVFDLYKILGVSPEGVPIRIDFAGMKIPVIDARYHVATHELVLEVSSLWAPSEWFLEERKNRTDKKRPQPEPGEP